MRITHYTFPQVAAASIFRRIGVGHPTHKSPRTLDYILIPPYVALHDSIVDVCPPQRRSGRLKIRKRPQAKDTGKTTSTVENSCCWESMVGPLCVRTLRCSCSPHLKWQWTSDTPESNSGQTDVLQTNQKPHWVGVSFCVQCSMSEIERGSACHSGFSEVL